MISRAILTRIDRQASQGRTGPVLAACENDEEAEVEVFMKLSAGCDQQVTNLARETIAACLAGDLGLPVPRPWLIEVPQEITKSVADRRISELLRDSSPVAFGSTSSPSFMAWSSGQRLTESMYPLAAEILLFDAIIQNPDRRSDNPNCLVRSNDLRIIDHELAFTHALIVEWRPPWVQGGMQTFEEPGHHIFLKELRDKQIDFEPIRGRWNGLSDSRLHEYKATIPQEWNAARRDIDAALRLVAEARDNIDACI